MKSVNNLTEVTKQLGRTYEKTLKKTLPPYILHSNRLCLVFTIRKQSWSHGGTFTFLGSLK